MDILDEAAQFLIKRETITGKEFMEIFNKYKNPEKESEKNVSETMEKDVETEKILRKMLKFLRLRQTK